VVSLRAGIGTTVLRDTTLVVDIMLTVHAQKMYCRCGKDLTALFEAPTLQHFLNSTPMHELNSDKVIYQPGSLRVVSDVIIITHSMYRA
jgi:hypothetical protein